MSREQDRKLLSDLTEDKLHDFIFMHLRNLWAVDGLYFLGIEEDFGTDAAREIDRRVWEAMGKIEARKLKEFLGIKGNDIQSMMKALQYSSWALDLEDKEVIVEKNHAIIRNVKCRVQNTRINKGLGEFGCKPVRFGFLKAFAREFNPDIEVKCNVCPPDKHPSDLWCEWEFKLKRR
ncbi:MAG: DUF6125 family protein [Candidatus Thermoplasmatota archaeon]|jgi:hypothetical protein|nr:DUF6125 family protein [Candidatus Thermoplasmatota archaeon]